MSDLCQNPEVRGYDCKGVEVSGFKDSYRAIKGLNTRHCLLKNYSS
jgi:hypothetical protein